MPKDYNNEDIAKALDLLVSQQQLTREIVEDILNEISVSKDLHENYAILNTKVNALESMMSNCDRNRHSCFKRWEDILNDLYNKRDQRGKDIIELERKLVEKIQDAKDKNKKDQETCFNDNRLKLESLQEKVAYAGGKYGALTSLIITIVLLLLQWMYQHHGGK